MFRSAMVSELTKINALIRASKAYWGYSDAFLDEFMAKWGMKEAYFHINEVVLIE